MVRVGAENVDSKTGRLVWSTGTYNRRRKEIRMMWVLARQLTGKRDAVRVLVSGIFCSKNSSQIYFLDLEKIQTLHYVFNVF